MSYARIVVVTLLALGLWAAAVVTGALFGWWRQPIAPTGDAQAFMRTAIEMIEERNRGKVALVLIEDGTIWGEHYASSADPVDRNTVFPAASMSKWIAAWAVMKLVEEGKLDLDRPVEDYLTRWHLPPSEFDNRGVTARRLLSHTAGLTDGLGFGDYQQDEAVTTLEQSLANPRASSGSPRRSLSESSPGASGGTLAAATLFSSCWSERFPGRRSKRSPSRPYSSRSE